MRPQGDFGTSNFIKISSRKCRNFFTSIYFNGNCTHDSAFCEFCMRYPMLTWSDVSSKLQLRIDCIFVAFSVNRRSTCFRSLSGSRCSNPIGTPVTLKDCCCTYELAAWGDACQVCPAKNTSEYNPIQLSSNGRSPKMGSKHSVGCTGASLVAKRCKNILGVTSHFRGSH